MRYLAILRDSWAEIFDRKSLYFLLALSGLVILVCASISFRELDAQSSIEYILKTFPTVVARSGLAAETFDFTAEAGPVEELPPPQEKAWKGGLRFPLRIRGRGPFHRAVAAWEAGEKGKPTASGEVTFRQEVAFFKDRFRDQMIFRCEIEPGETDPKEDTATFEVRLVPPRKTFLTGGHEVSVLFGLWKGPIPFSAGVLLLIVEGFLANWLAGFFGILLAVIITAGFIPNMIQKGTLDLVLCRPVRRAGVLLTKYAGSLLYVLVPATVLIGGSWLVLSWKADYYNFGFLATIPIVVALFAVLYSFSVLCGVVTRSTVATLFLTLGLWATAALVNLAVVAVRSPELSLGAPSGVVKALEITRACLPRTSEIGAMSGHFLARGNLPEEGFEAMQEEVTKMTGEGIRWGSVIASSVGFVAVMLGLACVIFSRKDY